MHSLAREFVLLALGSDCLFSPRFRTWLVANASGARMTVRSGMSGRSGMIVRVAHPGREDIPPSRRFATATSGSLAIGSNTLLGCLKRVATSSLSRAHLTARMPYRKRSHRDQADLPPLMVDFQLIRLFFSSAVL